MNIQFLILFMLTGGFGDLLGQNRLANNRLIHNYGRKNFRRQKMSSKSLMISLMAEMTKTLKGRKAIKKFMKIFEKQEPKKPSHYPRRIRA